LEVQLRVLNEAWLERSRRYFFTFVLGCPRQLSMGFLCSCVFSLAPVVW